MNTYLTHFGRIIVAIFVFFIVAKLGLFALAFLFGIAVIALIAFIIIGLIVGATEDTDEN